ncbi:DUF4231 domain-containing protein [Streptomyces sp. NRRL S-495]|uniref:DUF4231 domain-containing protein n=1 Tax=Streptomyces sp. NRRL S-495 TaxID=1609133 RepID=UPI0006965769|nr:DUF4231 domain-containing protein [Streptomyces sp. NRRL S-495]
MATPPHEAFTWHQLPPFFLDADAESIRSKRRYFGQLRLNLLLLFLAAAAGVVSLRTDGSGIDWAGFVAALAFISSILLRLYIVEQRDERRWYECRAAAESCKTLAWRYAVCGDPFPESMSADEARRLFIARLREISLDLDVVDVSFGLDINEAMERCRAADRSTRIETYRTYRLAEQVEWYARMAKLRDRQSRIWRRLALLGEMIGIVAGVLKAYNVLAIDLLGVVSAGVAGVTAWAQAQRLETEASAYSLTAREIRHILSVTDSGADAEAWGTFVDQAEAAISREHTMWASGRSGKIGLAG